MALYTCTNCGYSVESIYPGKSVDSCPGCRHRLETDGEHENEFQEHDNIFFDELMSGRTAEESYADELSEQPEQPEQLEHKWTRNRVPEEATPGPWRYSLQFNGSAKGYFRVWIINAILSILTLGIFIVWAKKRVRKYFSDTITLGGHPLCTFKDFASVSEHITAGYRENICAGNVTFECTAKASRLFLIRFSNMLMILISLGLLIPCAKVRKVRYIIRNCCIVSTQKIL